MEPTETEEVQLDSPNIPLTKSIDRQRALVSLLEEQLRDRKVDIDLLEEEEQKFYISNFYGTGSTDAIRITASHPELLAKKAILEERIGAFQGALTFQHDRLNKLNKDQRYDQLTTIFSGFKYLFIILGALILDRFIRRRFIRNIEEKGRRYLIAKLASASIYSIAILIVLSKVLSDHPSALASFAIIGAGLAVALQDIVKDVVAWSIILHRRLYTLGDRVSIGTHTGDIVDIGLLRTMLLEVNVSGPFNAHERTGKMLFIPNSLILKEYLLNYNTTSDFMSVEMKVTVTFTGDWKAAERILSEILKNETSDFTHQARKQQKRRTALFYTAWEVSEPEVHTDIVESGILFTLKFTVPIGARRDTVTKVSKRILKEFELAKNVHFAYKTIQVVGTK